MSIDFSYPRYLESKRSVDDRALNRSVFESLRGALDRRGSAEPLRVLEIGGGTGTMVRRLVDWHVLGKNGLAEAQYTLVDRDGDALAALPSRSLEGIDLQPVESDIARYLETTDSEFDLVIAHAVLDLIELETFLPLLWRRCAPHSHFWFTINFDGESVFLPPLDADEDIWKAYHDSMNRRPGSSRAGQTLFGALAESGARIESAGSSDWVVHPTDGEYPHEERYFLHHIIHTIDSELRGHAPIAEDAFEAWVTRRHAQATASQLIYIAHQLDFFGTPG